ncbi:AJAP1 protein, partial [Aegithalos caudatus]|nr:AJAP1 protein [Aegithalos caudatus]
SLSVHRSGCPLGSHAWILIAMFHLAMDLASCQPPATGTAGRLSPRPALRHRLSRGSLWGTGSGEELQRPGPPWTCAPAPPRPPSVEKLLSSRSAFHSSLGLSTQESSQYAPSGSSMPLLCLRTAFWEQAADTVSKQGWNHLCVAPAGAGVTPGASRTVPGLLEPLRSPVLDSVGAGGCWSPQLPSPLVSFLLSAGLAVHQIITITVSLIMVIAALITTLVLKNCCAQSGRPRRNSHQRKLDQQEESCQNLTDFAPARVPSALDIFTAYNETLQCSHECVRTPVPVYAEDTLHSPGDYKTTFNGNRPSSSDRHLIPVAFVSEKWFEISC